MIAGAILECKPDKRRGTAEAFDVRRMRVYPMGSTVNTVGNDGPECAEKSNEVTHTQINPLYV